MKDGLSCNRLAMQHTLAWCILIYYRGSISQARPSAKRNKSGHAFLVSVSQVASPSL